MLLWYSVVSYLYVSFSGLITSVREETAIFSAIMRFLFHSERFPLTLGA